MEFNNAAVEQAMIYQRAIMRALAGTWTWLKRVRGSRPLAWTALGGVPPRPLVCLTARRRNTNISD
jgi:hypothetical protein